MSLSSSVQAINAAMYRLRQDATLPYVARALFGNVLQHFSSLACEGEGLGAKTSQLNQLPGGAWRPLQIRACLVFENKQSLPCPLAEPIVAQEVRSPVLRGRGVVRWIGQDQIDLSLHFRATSRNCSDV